MKDVLVVGLGRCGLGAVMQMLDAAGVPTVGEFPGYEVVDADGSNLAEVVAAGEGRAIKLVDPRNYPRDVFRAAVATAKLVLVLKRTPREQAKSQCKFLQAVRALPSGKVSTVSIDNIAVSNARDQHHLHTDLLEGFGWLSISFDVLIARPQECAMALGGFLPDVKPFDVDRAARQIRKRFSRCHPTMLEVELIRTGRLLD